MIDKWTVPATVIEVVDGDTVRLDLDLGWHMTLRARVRIANIDSPETNTPEGLAAKAYAKTQLQPGDQVVFVSSSLDKYGRPLGSIVYGGAAMKDFALAMIDAGHARHVNW